MVADRPNDKNKAANSENLTAAQRYNPSIREMPGDDRPREKMVKYGSAALSDSELLAVLLRVGIQGENVLALSQRLLRDYGGLPGLSRIPLAELCALRGMGEAKASQLKAALEIGRRLLLAEPDQRLQVRSPGDIGNPLILEMAGLEQENLKLVMLDNKNQVIRMQTVYVGTINSSQVRIAEVFREAIRQNAASIIVAHNHPSGDPTPSAEDVRVTEEIIQAGKLLEIELLDHLVIGHHHFISLREKQLGFKN
jgi:DNA repair protein RadC